MASQPKKQRQRKKKNTGNEDDFSPPTEDIKITPGPPGESRRRHRGQAVNNSIAVAKSRLALIIDMLESTDDKGLDETTLRYNVSVALKHLKSVEQML